MTTERIHSTDLDTASDVPVAAGRVTIRPNPAPAGSEVTIEYRGTPPLYYRTAGNAEWKQVPLDRKTGRGRLRVPRGFRVMLFTDDEHMSAELLIVDPG